MADHVADKVPRFQVDEKWEKQWETQWEAQWETEWEIRIKVPGTLRIHAREVAIPPPSF